MKILKAIVLVTPFLVIVAIILVAASFLLTKLPAEAHVKSLLGQDFTSEEVTEYPPKDRPTFNSIICTKTVYTFEDGEVFETPCYIYKNWRTPTLG